MFRHTTAFDALLTTLDKEDIVDIGARKTAILTANSEAYDLALSFRRELGVALETYIKLGRKNPVGKFIVEVTGFGEPQHAPFCRDLILAIEQIFPLQPLKKDFILIMETLLTTLSTHIPKIISSNRLIISLLGLESSYIKKFSEILKTLQTAMEESQSGMINVKNNPLVADKQLNKSGYLLHESVHVETLYNPLFQKYIFGPQQEALLPIKRPGQT